MTKNLSNGISFVMKIIHIAFLVGIIFHAPGRDSVVHAAENSIADGEIINGAVDLSNATIYDENGNFLAKETYFAQQFNTIKLGDNSNDLSLYGIGGGTWSSGSGYSLVKGAKVTGKTNNRSHLKISFNCDFTIVRSGYDRINRIYGIQANGKGTVSYLNTGIMRSVETSSHSAYGGVRLQHNYSGISGNSPTTKTYWLYIRVGNNKYWVDSNLVI